ncbi:MAG: sterol desaturase family protein [Wenyingzhuangia sp.]|uniref:sterol desaturase family protein n=1 Tax=Wenyingzhuangia sp. TaxID=1964193 RepID=UPI00321BF6FB
MKVIIDSFYHTLTWIIKMITFQTHWYENYFWGLLVISFVIWLLEIAIPWRKNQSIFREDFKIDFFYMFFHFFIFALFINGFYATINNSFEQYGVTTRSLTLIDLNHFGTAQKLIIFFIISDFFQWFTHILMHRVPFLWRFHQVHHSVKEMGFAAHFRYHWAENIIYKPMKTIAIMVIGGVEPEQTYIIHFMAIILGHLNHSNLNITWGPLKYIFNNPVMHLYHHAQKLPEHKKHGMNFGISLSLWDYIFNTHYIPKVDENLKLGFKGDDSFPRSFVKHLWIGLPKTKK